MKRLWSNKRYLVLLYLLFVLFIGSAWFLSFDYLLTVSDSLESSNERLSTIAQTMSTFQEQVNQVDPSSPVPTDVVAQRQQLDEQLFYLEQARDRIVASTFSFLLWLGASYLVLVGLSWSLSYRLSRKKKERRPLWRDWVEFSLVAGFVLSLLLLVVAWLTGQFTVQNTFDPRPVDTILIPLLLAVGALYMAQVLFAGLRRAPIEKLPDYVRRLDARTHGRVLVMLFSVLVALTLLVWLAVYVLELSFLAAIIVLLLVPFPVIFGRQVLVELAR